MRKIIRKKLWFISVIILLQILGVFGYIKAQNLIENSRPSYVMKIYVPAIKEYLFSSNHGIFASVMNAVRPQDDQVNGGDAIAIPVLVYHGIVEEPDGENVTLDDFREQMFALKRAGYQTISIYDFEDFIKNGKSLPDKSFLLTFDDGRKDSYYPADPILRALNFRATMFVITGTSLSDRESGFYLNPQELEKMKESGRWDLQAHGDESHDMQYTTRDGKRGPFFGNKLWLAELDRQETEQEYTERIKKDLYDARRKLEDFGVEVNSFTFPFGDFGQNVSNYKNAQDVLIETVEDLYPLAFYQTWPARGATFNYPTANSFLIKRIKVEAEWSADNLIANLAAGAPKDLPYYDDFSTNRGWIKSVGDLYFDVSNMLTIGSSDTSTGGNAFLDGAYHWQDYRFEITGRWKKGETISLYGHYVDDVNYEACTFSDSGIRIERSTAQGKNILAESKMAQSLVGYDVALSFSDKDGQISCGINGRAVLAVADRSNMQGGIGLGVWSSQRGGSEFQVSTIKVN